MTDTSFDVVVVGAGMVGLSLCEQILNRGITNSIACVDKESEIGTHTSGRNSGVLHAGIYYKPNTLKANICIKGAQRLHSFIEEHKLPINKCGKVVVCQREELDSQLDLLYRRGKENGAEVEIISAKELKKLEPFAVTKSGRALWSPKTAVCSPKCVLRQLKKQLQEKGVRFFLGKNVSLQPTNNKVYFESGEHIEYGHLYNCAGLYAEKIAKLFDVGTEFTLLPFKGLYWQIKQTNSSLQIQRNVYPVPDLEMPFLGVHFTPSAGEEKTTYIGPTAVLAMGRENYSGLENLELKSYISNLAIIGEQFMANKGGFRKYFNEQAWLSFFPLMLKDAQRLIPSIKAKDLILSRKVGIRPQLFNKKTKNLEQDFICANGKQSTHILNAISPAFTASFELADLIIESSLLRK